MPRTARYIQDLTEQLSRMASQGGMRDLAYLLSMASEEAEAVVEKIAPPSPPRASAGDHG